MRYSAEQPQTGTSRLGEVEQGFETRDRFRDAIALLSLITEQ